jgi:hypothetical protein
MALRRLYRIVDSDGQGWFVAAPSMNEAIKKFAAWDEDGDFGIDEDNSVTCVGDLVDGGTREGDL